MTASATELDEIHAYARRWEQICALIHLDPDRDPIHTVFEPWEHRREQTGLAKREAHLAGPAETYAGSIDDDHPFFGPNDAAARKEQARVEKAFYDRQVKSLQLELLRLRAQLVGQTDTRVAVPRERQDIITVSATETRTVSGLRGGPAGVLPPGRPR